MVRSPPPSLATAVVGVLFVLSGKGACRASAKGPVMDDAGLVDGFGRMTFAPGLRTLSFYDRQTDAGSPPPTSPRSRFMKRLRAGLRAEKAVRDRYGQEREGLFDKVENERELGNPIDEGAVARRVLELDRAEAAEAEGAYNEAASGVVDDPVPPIDPTKASNKYQYVGVIDPTEKVRGGGGAGGGVDAMSSSGIKWYARKKPRRASWSVRLVHVDRAAIFHELYKRSKLDVYGSYRTAKRDPQTGRAIVRRTYTARPRAWYTLWNINPFHYFTNRSGNKFRDRRLPEGLYTDGARVYESSYDYKNGRAGMKMVSGNLTSYLDGEEGRSIDEAARVKLEERLTSGGHPDIVTEF